MQWSDVRRPGTRTLRQFGGLLALGGAAVMIFGEDLGVAGLIVGLLGAVGLALPRALAPLYVGWMAAVFPLGWLVSRLVLALLFCGLVTPIGVLLRLAGRDALARRRRSCPSYWARRREVMDSAQYFRQYGGGSP